ncbi:Not3-domain-containing protein [Metschnikowia bicuspidata var. bicuspidata NRRL YB-4993]|uniref:Not3-domain-containing protein n=1 Tax=Metschnikowia bicuspidata var. bicuspidata NRRL YB-4993 TaxID=869754 RepID=A0A1A0H874_9ASCO|nr:Not3-domain-containing protein [Metschnikowia bicuspidata var. bicuspidata NRRL YB-4993]OBA20092.1 Not3-domain-containing protein [Metschnikowia bicuspidata var. bicuspidata NRRL YB-4993]
MSNRKLQKEVETIFKKIHEGLDLFNYYYSRHESSTNDSQREKLESDLKKEIKKLQKFRDQIKTWQGNDSLEATIASLKLQEHRRLVEEAMECYKEVEKNSKMKSFSNQSIMLASLDNGEHELSPEVEDAYEYLAGVTDELLEQNEQLESEYEKISQKKVRKNNLLIIEERKQELENLRQRNEFHIAKIESVMSYLKTNKISVQLIWEIQEDLNFYVESNQEPDFIDDETLYDHLIKEARENQENKTNVMNEIPAHADPTLLHNEEYSAPNGSSDSVTKSQAPKLKFASEASASSSESPLVSEIPSKQVMTPKAKLTGKSLVLEPSSPAFVTTLKPASAPSKPVAGLKWSIAAAGTSQNGDTPPPSPFLSQEKSVPLKYSDNIKEEPNVAISTEGSKIIPDTYTNDQNEIDASSELLSLLTKNEEYSPYLDVLQNSNLGVVELEFFKDVEMLKSPSGIQEFASSFIAANKLSQSGMFLKKQIKYSPFSDALSKPYLPQEGLGSGLSCFRPPLFSSKLHSYWSRTRMSNRFNQLLDEIQSLEDQNTPESSDLAKDLVMVLFYGYYYGYLPLENIIAESLLQRLGWKPYCFSAEAAASPISTVQNILWFKKISRSVQHSDEGLDIDSGDFMVFDVNSWEISVKFGFRFDPRLSRNNPATTLA